MSLIITIQHCINCQHHKWCSMHDQKKYKNYSDQLKSHILKKFTNHQVEVKVNVVPNGYKKLGKDKKNNKYIDQKTAQVVIFPKLGAFEIEIDGILIYSKIHSSAWPNYDQIIDKIAQMKKDKQDGNDLSHHQIVIKNKQKQTQKKEKKYDNYLKSNGSSPSHMRKTHYANGKGFGKLNDTYIEEITKIYQLNNNIPTRLIGNRKNIPKILRDELSQVHRNQSDFEKQQKDEKKINFKDKDEINKRGSMTHYNKKHQIKGIQYLQLSPFQIARRKRHSQQKQKKISQDKKIQKRKSKDIIISNGIYFPQMKNRPDPFGQNLLRQNNPEQVNIRIVRQIQRLDGLDNQNMDQVSLQKEVMNILKEEELKDDIKNKTNPRELLKKKLAMKKAEKINISKNSNLPAVNTFKNNNNNNILQKEDINSQSKNESQIKYQKNQKQQNIKQNSKIEVDKNEKINENLKEEKIQINKDFQVQQKNNNEINQKISQSNQLKEQIKKTSNEKKSEQRIQDVELKKSQENSQKNLKSKQVEQVQLFKNLQKQAQPKNVKEASQMKYSQPQIIDQKQQNNQQQLNKESINKMQIQNIVKQNSNQKQQQKYENDMEKINQTENIDNIMNNQEVQNKQQQQQQQNVQQSLKIEQNVINENNNKNEIQQDLKNQQQERQNQNQKEKEKEKEEK